MLNNINTNRMTFSVFMCSLISLVLFSASIYLVFFFSDSSPGFNELVKINVKKNQVACMEYRSSKKPTYQVELINYTNSAYSITLTNEECAKIASALSAAGSTRLLVDQSPPRLFGNRWDIYQVEADEKVVLSYQKTINSRATQSKEFFYGGVFFLLLVATVIANLAFQKWRNG